LFDEPRSCPIISAIQQTMVGLVSGLILLYFFKIKTVRTPLFTGFNHEGKAIDFLNHENLALLVVW